MNATIENWFQRSKRLAGDYSFKGLKSMNGMDGMAWYGVLYFGNKSIGEVRDDGNGGMLYVKIDPAFKAQVKADSVAYYAATKEETITDDTFKYVSAEEFFLPFLADSQEARNKIAAKCKKVVCAIPADAKDGEYVAWKAGSLAHLESIKAKNPTYFFLNGNV